MSANIRTENIQTTISALDGDFSGRTGSLDYDEQKPIHIHRRNRAFVWNTQMQIALLDSILKGYYIPPIICGSRIISTGPTSGYIERREVMEGGNRITTFRRILRNEVRELTPEERRMVESHPITLVVMRNLTSKQTREMFRRLNKNVKVSDGQLYSMSEEDSPLVREALALLNDDDYPLRTQTTEHFFDTRHRDNDRKANLENAIALVSGAVNGPTFITKVFAKQEEHVETQTPIDQNQVVAILGYVFDVFRQANAIMNLTDGRKKKSQWTVGNYLGVILYDILMNLGSIPQIQHKWATYIGRVRTEHEHATEAIVVSGAQNLNVDKLKRMSTKVGVYIQENRIMTKDELDAIRHPIDEEMDSDEESIGTDEGEQIFNTF